MFIKFKFKSILFLAAFAFIATAQNGYSQTTADQLLPDKWIVDIAQASRQGLDKLCGKNEYFRKTSGSVCKNYSQGVIAMFVCGKDPEFLTSQCAKNIKFPAGKKADFQEAKAILKAAVMEPVVVSKTGEVFFKNAKWFACHAFTPNIPNLTEFRNDPDIQTRCKNIPAETPQLQAAPKQGVAPSGPLAVEPKLIEPVQVPNAVLMKVETSSNKKADLLKEAQKLSDALKNLSSKGLSGSQSTKVSESRKSLDSATTYDDWMKKAEELEKIMLEAMK